ncbi:hypothetical protein GCM10020220_038620 [Nonomuraea rubra]
MRRRLGFGGTLVATLFACASLTPSLLPRTWLYQGVMGAVTGILGYAVGAAIGALCRTVIRLPERGRRAAWRVMLAGCGVLAVVALWYSFDWQRDLRALMGMDTRITWFPPVILAVTLVLFAAALLAARLVRLGGRKLNAWLDRYVPVYVGHAVGVLVIASLVALFANDVLFNGFRGQGERHLVRRERGHASGRAPAGLRVPVGRAEVAGELGVAGQGGAPVHRHGGDAGAAAGVLGTAGHGADQGLHRP